MIFPLRRGSAEVIYAARDGVFIKELDSGIYMLASDNFEKSIELVENTGTPPHICLYQKDIADYLFDRHNYNKYAINVQAVYTHEKYINTDSRVLDIKKLTYSNFDWLCEHNSHLERQYLEERLAAGAVYGGFINNELCCSIGTHAEGSVGMLHVSEKFRGMGYAYELLSYIVNLLLDKKHIPFSQIEYDNIASINLHKKIGFEIFADMLYRLID
jgi:GNAT superfamily N-acetyltransferase